MEKILLKYLLALRKVGMLLFVCVLSTNMTAQIIAESFEGPQFLPNGWGNSSGSQWYLHLDDATNGTKSLRMEDERVRMGVFANTLSTPPIALIEGQTVSISFDYKIDGIGENGGYIRIYQSTSSTNVNDIGIDNYLQEILLDEPISYTNFSLNFTAQESKDYYFTLYLVGNANDNYFTYNYFKLLLDSFIIENVSNCLAPTNIIVNNTTSNSVTIDWNEIGTATSWEVQVTNGDLPVSSNWIPAETSQKDINIAPGIHYSAYVRSKCDDGEFSSFYGPIGFMFPCPEIIKAPYNIPFIEKNLPGCWQQDGDTNWKFSTGANYASGKATDHTLFTGYTQYAWVDGTSNTSGKKAVLISPKIDVSGLSNPAVEFYVYSENDNNDVFNKLFVEVYDGAAWQTAVTSTTASNGWKFYSIDLAALNIVNITQVKFTVIGNEENETTYYNDILIDDISFREKSTCLPVSNFSTGVITDVSAEIFWNSDNDVNTWDVSYGKYGYSFGGNANITGVSNSHILNELESGTQYQVYIRANCGNGTVGEWTGPYYLKTDCSVYEPYYHESFIGLTAPPYDYYSPGMPNCWVEAFGGDLINGPSEYGIGNWKITQPNGLDVVGFSETVSILFNGNEDKSWILSPLFNLSEKQYEAKVTIAINPGNAGYISMGSDDKVYMLYSENGVTWNILKTWSAEDNLSTGFHTSIISLESIDGENVRLAFMTDEGVIVDDITYKFHLDDLIVREKSTCLEALNLFAYGITHQSAKISWENPGIATSWKVAVVPAGVTPTNEWQTALSNPYTAQNLTANTSYDVYVKSVCGGIESEIMTGPFKFKTRCSPIMAPYTETFVDYYEKPDCWMLNPEGLNTGLFTVLYWNFSTEAKYEAAEAGDHTEGGETQYAWFSTESLGNKQSGFLSTPLVDVSSLQNPALQFYVFSKNTIDSVLNHLTVEVYNGMQWLKVTQIENYTNSWAPYTIDLAELGATEIIEVRFTVTVNSNGGNPGFHLILIDDVSFIEMPQCIAPINLAVTEISDTSAKVVWEDQGTSTSWEIEYGPKGFIVGEGTVITVNTTPELFLTELDDNQEYEVYIKSLCDEEIVGPQIFITETTSGINGLEKAKIVLYPNPVTDVLNIESDTIVDGVEVYNIVGQLVKKQFFNTDFAVVTMNDLSEGVYMVKAFSGKTITTYKVIKK